MASDVRLLGRPVVSILDCAVSKPSASVLMSIENDRRNNADALPESLPEQFQQIITSSNEVVLLWQVAAPKPKACTHNPDWNFEGRSVKIKLNLYHEIAFSTRPEAATAYLNRSIIQVYSHKATKSVSDDVLTLQGITASVKVDS